MHSDRINVGYILTLLQLVLNTDDEQKRKQYEAQIHDLIGSEVGLHDKQELIKKFIEDNMPKMINQFEQNIDNLPSELSDFT